MSPSRSIQRRQRLIWAVIHRLRGGETTVLVMQATNA